MFALRIVQTDYGDCFLLGYGSAANPRWILVDGGSKEVHGDHLRSELERLADHESRLGAAGRLDSLGTLIWMVEAAHEADRPIRITATNDAPALRKLPQEYPPDEYDYTLDIMPPEQSSWDLDLESA